MLIVKVIRELEYQLGFGSFRHLKVSFFKGGIIYYGFKASWVASWLVAGIFLAGNLSIGVTMKAFLGSWSWNHHSNYSSKRRFCNFGKRFELYLGIFWDK